MQYEPFHVELTIDPKGRVTLPVQLRMALRVLAEDEMRRFSSDDARYLALRNRESTRLDAVLDLCRTRV